MGPGLFRSAWQCIKKIQGSGSVRPGVAVFKPGRMDPDPPSHVPSQFESIEVNEVSAVQP